MAVSRGAPRLADEHSQIHFPFISIYLTSGESRAKKSLSIVGILSLAGQSSCGSTRNALARQSSSKSETQRNCVSILASVCRLKSHPHRRQRAASMGCVSPCWPRKRRICSPTRLRGFFVIVPASELKSTESGTPKGSEFRTVISAVLACHAGGFGENPFKVSSVSKIPEE